MTRTDVELGDGWADAVHLESVVTFDLRDRLRVLFGWTPAIKTRTKTEHVIGKTLTDRNSVRMVAPRWWRRVFPPRRVGWMAESPSEQPRAAPSSPPDPSTEIG